MKRYIVAHWRGELSLVKSFLVNGVLAFVMLGMALPGLTLFGTSNIIAYIGLSVVLIWETWAVVGIVRCAFRTFREPRSTLGPFWARRGFAVLAVLVSAAFVYGTIGDIRMLLR
jgi:hypothetical protein